MHILERLLQPLSFDSFRHDYLFQKPYAAPFAARSFERLVSWRMLGEIFTADHDECWLPRTGKLPEDPLMASGRLTLFQAIAGFRQGRTVLIRHGERSHRKLAEIAEDFHGLFGKPVDVQLYCTPAGEEGFDWHYDAEEVFVIQTTGEKEFRLKKSTEDIQEIHCWLRAGDWLYIPSGYWHKARALTESYHISVGVMAKG